MPTAEAFAGERHALRLTSIANPPAGNSAVYIVPANEVHQIVGVSFNLVTDATATKRQARIFSLDSLGANPFQPTVSAVVQVENLTWTYYFSCGIAPGDLSGDWNAVYTPLVCGIQLVELERLDLTAYGLQAGDQIQDARVRAFVWKDN